MGHETLESKDQDALANPRRTVLEPGGRIFFAVRQGLTVGCCALLAMGPGEYEVAKMAVTESCRGAGIGRRLLERAIAKARASGAARLYLETNQNLTPAIRLYESVGFRHLPTFQQSASFPLHMPAPTFKWNCASTSPCSQFADNRSLMRSCEKFKFEPPMNADKSLIFFIRVHPCSAVAIFLFGFSGSGCPNT